ncbi:fused protease/ribonucleoside-triphosphate reductase [Sulfurovum sp. zt1-1]|uniref:ribonucleoside-triphosphate reductase (thioredoxin) n=1 Tax=Sulfurovum zhangzhouensis TaxID=3019067 RepID=A0ABT7QVG0_9BACT|nr:fused protease/ribonucleoside-triphosphate reductase [Sulfurovum zhangzhouensis]MDM5270806.1 fused protease/ribonucleoside-triphosphate reductase [Sulfurovum zhangzhouensis]
MNSKKQNSAFSHTIVKERFALETSFCNALYAKKTHFGFGGFGEATYYRTYSRMKADGSQEHWADTVIRAINGVMSIRKNHYVVNKLAWDDSAWQPYAKNLALTMFDMKWLPPGRGLWIMGTEYIYERGAAALNNCGAVDTTDLSLAADWTMDMLMCGVGVGFNTAWKGENVVMPDKTKPLSYTIPDSREGWVSSVRLLIESYTKGKEWFVFDYSKIRPEGSPIRGFGGTASGPSPLKELHKRMENTMDSFYHGAIDKTRCIVDIMNEIGACVVAGNVRRSAQIALGSIDDKTFLELKDYTKYPERAQIGWMSNNTVVLEKTEDFKQLPLIAKHIRDNGEPGIMNLINVQRYGRYGEHSEDKAWLTNPCSEIPLESFELCNLAEVFPARCNNEEEFYEALEFATFYASTVALLPTHRSESNAIIVRNRRIGVSLSGIADMLDTLGATELTRRLRKGYKLVVSTNQALAAKAGIPDSIRVTTVKPSGTISQLVGVSSGMHFPTFRYAIRRMRVGTTSVISKVLKAAGVPYEEDLYSKNTTVFEFPIYQGKTRKASSVSAWEQFSLLAMLQREWSDNMVSCTIYFDPKEEGEQIEHMLAQFAPLIKSVSMLPHTKIGAYKQMPYEGITKEEYEKRLSELQKIDWNSFSGSDGVELRFCTDDICYL